MKKINKFTLIDMYCRLYIMICNQLMMHVNIKE